MEESQVAFVLGTLLLGGVLAFLGYYLASRKRRQSLAAKRRSETTSKNVTDADEKKPSDQREVSGPAGGGASNSSKRQAKSKKRREAQQEFSHSWMVGALKGHTAPVLDMDFSANGKFLASCAEDCGLKEDASAEPTSPIAAAAAAAAAVTGSSSASAANAKASRSASSTKAKSAASATAPPSPSSSSSSSSSSSNSSVKEEHQRAILSRRQRKNRTRAPREQRRELRERDEDHEDDHNGPPPKPTKSSSAKEEHAKSKEQKKTANDHHHHHHQKSHNSAAEHQKSDAGKKSKQHQQPNSSAYSISKPGQLHQLTDAALASLLRRYTLTGDQLAHLGYPVELSHFPGYAIIVNYQQHPLSLRSHHRHHHHGHGHGRQHHLDVNAREFVPGSWSGGIEAGELDSGNGSASSSLESSDLEQESASDSDKSSDVGEAGAGHHPEELLHKRLLQDAIERRCARCYRSFYVGREDGEYLHEEKCCYHWGKLRSGLDGAGESWECCRGRETSRGCTQAKAHVWTGIVPGYNGPFHDYARTRPARQPPRDGNYGVYALDCEMCFTKRGLELGKVTVVALDGSLVYEALCKPDAEVVDYNTRFSGLRAKDLARATKSLRDVQKDILGFVSAETILIGHGLENDLRALRLLHPTVIDTCVAFPHFLGYPFRSSLKTLARTVLRKEIQVKEHDSAEDARIAVDLMLKRLQHDFF